MGIYVMLRRLPAPTDGPLDDGRWIDEHDSRDDEPGTGDVVTSLELGKDWDGLDRALRSAGLSFDLVHGEPMTDEDEEQEYRPTGLLRPDQVRVVAQEIGAVTRGEIDVMVDGLRGDPDDLYSADSWFDMDAADLLWRHVQRLQEFTRSAVADDHAVISCMY